MGVRPKIVVIDDNLAILSLLHTTLLKDGYEVFLASNGSEGLHLIRVHCPDIIILDYFFPDSSIGGIEIVSRLRAAYDGTPIIAISAVEDSQVEWIENNVDVFVRKPFQPRHLRRIIQAVLQKTKEKPVPQQEPSNVLRFADLELDMQARTVRRIGVRQFELTAREFDLLAFLMSNPRRVLARSVILDRVWGFDFEGESNVVDVYVGYLRKKLKVKGGSGLIQTVRSVGYVLREDERGEEE